MNNNKSIKEQLDEYRLKYDLYDQRLCTDEENKAYRELLKQGEKLPEDIYPIDPSLEDMNITGKTKFLELLRTELTQAEIMEYLMYQKLDMLTTIRNCIVFFTVLAGIALLLSFIIPIL